MLTACLVTYPAALSRLVWYPAAPQTSVLLATSTLTSLREWATGGGCVVVVVGGVVVSVVDATNVVVAAGASVVVGAGGVDVVSPLLVPPVAVVVMSGESSPRASTTTPIRTANSTSRAPLTALMFTGLPWAISQLGGHSGLLGETPQLLQLDSHIRYFVSD